MTAALMITIGFFNTPRIIGSIAASFIFLLSAFCRANRIKKFKQKKLGRPQRKPVKRLSRQTIGEYLKTRGGVGASLQTYL